MKLKGLLTALILLFGRSAALWSQEIPAPADQIQNTVLDRADDILKEVSRLSGLPIKYPVKKEMKDPAFFSHYFLGLLKEQYPPEKKEALEKAYVFYGFLAPGTDLVGSYQGSMLKNVEGIYDPAAKALYLADRPDEDPPEEVLAHELTHALQDQSFDLRVYMDQERGASMDYQFAHDSVMEGQAVAIALDYSLREQGKDFTQLENIGDAARLADQLNESGQKAFGRKAILPDVADFPYIYGTAFLQKYVKVYGWQGMKYLFEHPPTSTHQILHPETFFPRRRNPIEVGIEDLSKGALKGRRLIWEDSFGEYGLSLVLARYLSGEEARNAVTGWQGDRFQLYEKAGSLIGVGYVILEDESSAEKFFEAAKELLGFKYHIDPAGSMEGGFFLSELGGTGLEICVERRGRRVILIEGTKTNETNKVRAALWDVKRRTRSSSP